MKPDLLITHIKHTDYPIWRANLAKDRHHFNKVIILFSEHNRWPYVDHFIQSSLSNLDITFLDPKQYDYGKEDWRNVATNEMLKYSDSEWLCSIEQDWLCQDWNKLFELCEEAMKSSDLFGWMNPTNNPYIHPSFWFVRRYLLDSIGHDFTPHHEINGSDHFAMITYKAKEKGAIIRTLPIGEVSPNSLAFHLGGVNQNYLDGLNSGIFHRPDIFASYNYWNMKVDVEQSPVFMEMMKKVGEKLPYKDNTWDEFFK